MTRAAKTSVTRADRRPAFPASPALEAAIAAYRTARAETERARRAYRQLAEAARELNKAQRPSDAALHAAMDAVPVPAILQAPKAGPVAVAVVLEYADGTTRREPLSASALYTLAGEDAIRERYRDDPAKTAEALAAYKEWQQARMAAHAAAFAASETAEWRKADRAARRAYRPVRDAARREAAAFRAVAAFEPQTPADAVALAAFLLKDQADAAIAADGTVRRIDLDEPFHPHDLKDGNVFTRSLTVLFRALIDARDNPPVVISGREAINALCDRNSVGYAQAMLEAHNARPGSTHATALSLVTEYEACGGEVYCVEGSGVFVGEVHEGDFTRRAAEIARALLDAGLQPALQTYLTQTGRVHPAHEDAIAAAPDRTRSPEPAFAHH